MIASSPPAYVVRWVGTYNRQLQRAGKDYRVKGIVHCQPDGEAMSRCVVLVFDSATGQGGCYRVTIDTSGRLWRAPRVSCTTNAGTGPNFS